MIRIFFLCVTVWVATLSSSSAQVQAGAARVLLSESGVSEGWFGSTELQVTLSHGVPFRVFTLDEPARLVVDFQGLDWSDVAAEQFLGDDVGLPAVRFGTMQAGWSRLVADMSRPMLPQEIGMTIDESSGVARLKIDLEPVAPEEFLAEAGPPTGSHWPVLTDPVVATPQSDSFVVAIDPGHGGIDPGAERGGVSEKALMLDVAFELRELLALQPDIEVVLTRESDIFVALERRVAIAHQVDADLFVSLHADALSEGGAHGATIYTLSEEASDAASAHLAARHNRSDIIAGIDLSGSDDQVTQVLLDLARQETDPRSAALAQSFVDSMSEAGGPMNRRPLRQAGFSVLKSADIPSILVEVGFLSSKRDLENLQDPAWRSGMARAMADAILNWRDADEDMRALMRH